MVVSGTGPLVAVQAFLFPRGSFYCVSQNQKQVFQFELSLLSPSEQDEVNHGEINALRQALAQQEKQAFQSFKEHEAPKWLLTHNSLPFKCTECGKCCQTIGDVYMSPEESAAAAEAMGLSYSSFVQRYASHRLLEGGKFVAHFSNNNEDVEYCWIRLRDQAFSDGTAACVFLDQETKHCQIYENRPVQCRTYPFWPSIMASPDTWNIEVVAKAEEDNCSAVESKHWTPENGGCEGMQVIKESSSLDTLDDENGTPIEEGYEKLYQYTQDRRRYMQFLKKRGEQ